MPPLYIAGGPHADLDGVFSGRSEAKLVVEGGNAIDSAIVYLKILGDLQHCLLGQVTELHLHVLQNGNELSALMGCQYSIQCLFFLCAQIFQLFTDQTFAKRSSTRRSSSSGFTGFWM